VPVDLGAGLIDPTVGVQCGAVNGSRSCERFSVTDKDDDSWRAWRAELERRGVENVRLKLMAAGVGRGALVRGFEDPPEIPRDFVEGWVSAEERKTARQRHWTLFLAIVGGVACLVGVVIAFLK
jgi:hypothetical protein